MVKNPPAVQETKVRSLGQEDPLEKDTTTHSSMPGEFSVHDRGAWKGTVHGVPRSHTRLRD